MVTAMATTMAATAAAVAARQRWRAIDDMTSTVLLMMVATVEARATVAVMAAVRAGHQR